MYVKIPSYLETFHCEYFKLCIHFSLFFPHSTTKRLIQLFKLSFFTGPEGNNDWTRERRLLNFVLKESACLSDPILFLFFFFFPTIGLFIYFTSCAGLNLLSSPPFSAEKGTPPIQVNALHQVGVGVGAFSIEARQGSFLTNLF